MINPSDGFVSWLHANNVSLAITTYRANRLLLVGTANENGLRLKVNERLFDRPMGLFYAKESLWMAGRSHIWRLDNLLDSGMTHEGGDVLFAPVMSWLTGEVNAHEIVLNSSSEPVFVNTAFSCLAGLSIGSSFEPQWQPSFVDRLLPHDQCHLNGVALLEGVPKWVTACGTKHGAAAWRDQRHGGGVVLAMDSSEPVLQGLSMPHSPRWHQGRLWVLNSGLGELGFADDGHFKSIISLPGFVRGLTFLGDYALVGLSQLRSINFTGLPLEERLQQSETPKGLCGIAVVNLSNGMQEHFLELRAPIDEIFDLSLLMGVRRPRALGLVGGLSENLIKLPNHDELILVKPTVPSGRLSQGPAIPMVGVPEAAQAQLANPSLIQNLKYQKILELNLENLSPYVELTYPRLDPRSVAGQRIKHALLGVCAIAGSSMIGMAIAEQHRDLNNARLVSLLVLPEFRCQGVGTKLLGYLMTLLAQQGCDLISIDEDRSILEGETFKNLLERLGWVTAPSAPTSRMIWSKQLI